MWDTDMLDDGIDWDTVDLDTVTVEQLEAKEGEVIDDLEETLSENSMENVRLIMTIERELESRGE